MATKTYTTYYESYYPEATAGTDELGRAGAYITSRGNSYYAVESVNNYVNPRVFFGRDIPGGETAWDESHWYYCYCAKIKVPVGKNFAYSFSLGYTGIGGPWSNPIRYGWSLTAPSEGDARCTGNVDSPAGLDAIGVYEGATSSAGTITLNATFPDSYSGKTAYLFIWGQRNHKDDPSGTWLTCYNCAKVDSLGATLTYTDYTAVSKPSIKSLDRVRLTPGGNIVLTINPSSNGTANALTGYKIYYGTSKNAVTTAVATKKTATNNKITVSYTDLGSPARGTTLYLGIQAIGTQAGYDSGISTNENHYVKINSLPTAPAVTLSDNKVPKNGGNWKVKITAISSTDSDKDTLAYFYYVSDANSLPNSPVWIAAAVNTEITCSSTNKYIYFMASDGYEIGPSTKKTMTANSPPVAIIKNYSGSSFQGYDGYIYTRKISATTDTTASTYSWRYRYGSSGDGRIFSSTKSPSNVTLNSGTGKIQIKLTVTDGYGDSTSTDWTNTGMRYANNWTTDSLDIGLANRHNSVDPSVGHSRRMKANFGFDKMTANDTYITKIKVILQDKEDGSGTAINTLEQSGELYTSKTNSTSLDLNLNWDFMKTKDYGKLFIKFICYGSNAAGGEVIVFERIMPTTLFPLLPQVFADDEVPELSFSLKDNNSAKINVNAGTEENGISNMRVLVENGGEYYDISEYVSLKLGADLAASELTLSNPQKIFQLSHLKNDKRNIKCYAYIIPVNKAGDGINWNDPANVAYTENKKIKLKFEALFNPIFIAKSSNAPRILPQVSFSTGYSGPDWDNEGEIEDHQRRINPGEKIKIIHDYTISRQFNLKYEGDGSDPIEITEDDYEYNLEYCLDSIGGQWNTVDSWSGKTEANNIYFTVPQLTSSLNEREIFLRLTVKDNTNNLQVKNDDEKGLWSSNYLLLCRKNTPSIELTDCDFTQDGDYSIKLQVEDYGGNGRGYVNFRRFVSNQPANSKEGKYEIQFYFSPNADSLYDNYEIKTGELTESVLSGNGDFKITKKDFNATKIYFFAHVKFYINEDNDYIELKTNIITLYAEGPTVSYRAHHLGINTQQNVLKDYDKDILTITDFRDKRYVRLKGEYSDEYGNFSQKEIIIDLKLGQISGLCVDCGSWD